MKQLNEICEFHNRFSGKENEMAFAILYHVDGSTYRKTGARMLVHISGEYAGGISGGCLESDIQKKAKLNLMLNRSEIVTYNTSKKNNSVGSNLGCDGGLKILLHPLNYGSEFNPVSVLKKIVNSREPQVLCTIVHSHHDKFNSLIGNVYDKKNLNENLTKNFPELDELNYLSEEILSNGQSEFITLKNQDELLMDVFVEYISPAVQLVIVGEQKDVAPLANIAEILGWQVLLCGRRAKYSESLLKIVRQIETADVNESSIDENTAIVFMSHDFDADVVNLPNVINSKAFYIGVLGPERRKIKLLTAIDQLELKEKINGPIGINIGSKSPEEIALATCAEVQGAHSVRSLPRPLSEGEGGSVRRRNADNLKTKEIA